MARRSSFAPSSVSSATAGEDIDSDEHTLAPPPTAAADDSLGDAMGLGSSPSVRFTPSLTSSSGLATTVARRHDPLMLTNHNTCTHNAIHVASNGSLPRRQKHKVRAEGNGVDLYVLPSDPVTEPMSTVVLILPSAGVMRLPPRETATVRSTVGSPSYGSSGAQMAEHWLAVLEDAQEAADAARAAAGNALRKRDVTPTKP